MYHKRRICAVENEFVLSEAKILYLLRQIWSLMKYVG